MTAKLFKELAIEWISISTPSATGEPGGPVWKARIGQRGGSKRARLEIPLHVAAPLPTPALMRTGQASLTWLDKHGNPVRRDSDLEIEVFAGLAWRLDAELRLSEALPRTALEHLPAQRRGRDVILKGPVGAAVALSARAPQRDLDGVEHGLERVQATLLESLREALAGSKFLPDGTEVAELLEQPAAYADRLAKLGYDHGLRARAVDVGRERIALIRRVQQIEAELASTEGRPAERR
jgi:hypothetical protein